ncbi:MAG: hypothetical protein M3163_07390 [Actinomycetota bacterium]|nr:hypothetical protein [Actinomycetota bacterium]
MAELPELWSERTPEQRHLYGREPSFGAARDAERMRLGIPPEPVARRARRQRGPFVTHLRMPWSYSERGPGDAWHRMRCWRGRHDMAGGHTMQLGSAVVFIERECRWCGEKAG